MMDTKEEERFREIQSFLGEQFSAVKDLIDPSSGGYIPPRAGEDNYNEIMSLATKIAKEYREYTMALDKK